MNKSKKILKEDEQLFAKIWITRDGEVSLELTDEYKDTAMADTRNIILKISDAIFGFVDRERLALGEYIAKHESSRIIDISGQRILTQETINPSPN